MPRRQVSVIAVQSRQRKGGQPQGCSDQACGDAVLFLEERGRHLTGPKTALAALHKLCRRTYSQPAVVGESRCSEAGRRSQECDGLCRRQAAIEEEAAACDNCRGPVSNCCASVYTHMV